MRFSYKRCNFSRVCLIAYSWRWRQKPWQGLLKAFFANYYPPPRMSLKMYSPSTPLRAQEARIKLSLFRLCAFVKAWTGHRAFSSNPEAQAPWGRFPINQNFRFEFLATSSSECNSIFKNFQKKDNCAWCTRSVPNFENFFSFNFAPRIGHLR